MEEFVLFFGGFLDYERFFFLNVGFESRLESFERRKSAEKRAENGLFSRDIISFCRVLQRLYLLPS